MRKLQPALVGLGANQRFAGRAPAALLVAAAAAIGRLGEGARLSPLYRSVAWPDPTGPAYVNAVMRLETALSPEALLGALLAIEAAFGRRREGLYRYAPRSMDLDLLAVGEERRSGEALTLPHPRLSERLFVLRPLADLVPTWRHPLTGTPVAQLVTSARGPAVHRLPFTGEALAPEAVLL
ncbi:2-amino-4-hydroxy-6-hydroxymethyldihydropteridine pyrophosphokinase [Parvularcula bermudensis HTCC2503]|uniref:2-amino-4-hydroxy-6-hydroxymethyldihydropteridine pyrophosphokinase n=1 Tax=Parvularcula bermudensis (strain ATCC BAA-594 / HTCC2503 / KCTC 12087) TaxID=314260 RepID=E0TB52_PARBH|nr:2-amino-4-hydroxy-6-hydroxymethyldihydropteridine diphosphokinase [Parvularcula bermudensis]ADM09727.1 2-amino-4-hydroxy-6-hydroxymethyldihydropteridine pyrophosphokinase [Parvularcula bermudensis HTCC2503]